jgi:hypothetical protein
MFWSSGRGVIKPKVLRHIEVGTLPWVVKVERTNRLMVGIVAGVVNLQKN